MKKGKGKKPIKEKFSLIQSLAPRQSPETVKNTLYFRNSVELAPLQQTDLLLTSPKPLSDQLHDAVFQPASKIEQLKVDIIEQSDDINTEFIAAITNGKNSNVFKLGQKFGYIFHLISLLFVWYGFRQTIAS